MMPKYGNSYLDTAVDFKCGNNSFQTGTGERVVVPLNVLKIDVSKSYI